LEVKQSPIAMNLILLFSIKQIILIIKNNPILFTKTIIILPILNNKKRGISINKKDQNQNFHCSRINLIFQTNPPQA